MRQIGVMCVAVLATGVAMGQMAGISAPPPGPSGPAAEAQRGYAGGNKVNILKSADLMPADGYPFMPTKDVRTYARILNHISEAQLHTCGAVNGTANKDLAKVPPETADKPAIIEALKASFAECDKAFASLTDANLVDMISVGPMKRSRIGLLWGNVSHNNEQYSALAMYLRLKGLVPPSSEK